MYCQTLLTTITKLQPATVLVPQVGSLVCQLSKSGVTTENSSKKLLYTTSRKYYTYKENGIFQHYKQLVRSHQLYFSECFPVKLPGSLVLPHFLSTTR